MKTDQRASDDGKQVNEVVIHGKQVNEVVLGGIKIAQTLAVVPDAEVRRMQERALEMAPRVLYRRHGSTEELREAGKYAINLDVDSVHRRIHMRVSALEAHGLALLTTFSWIWTIFPCKYLEPFAFSSVPVVYLSSTALSKWFSTNFSGLLHTLGV